jgi:prepilin-type N-terminal cleavage/methylation domain-containing protein
MKTLPNINKKGFTLIELLVVIGILAILLSIVLIAINPARQFGQANNTRRMSEVTQILNAVGAYAADHKGILPPTLTLAVGASGSALITSEAAVPTPTPTSGYGTATVVNLCSDLVTTYIPALPQDPQVGTGTAITDCGSTYNTGYVIAKDNNNRVTVSAPWAEAGEVFSNAR